MNHEYNPCCSVRRAGRSLPIQEDFPAPTDKEIRFFEKMIRVEGGSFLMGTQDTDAIAGDYEGPIRNRTVDSFYMDSYAVTNEEFLQFVAETEYRTEAERFGWSFVFHQFIHPSLKTGVQRVANTPWWIAVEGANWLQPEGPGSHIADRMDHPISQVSWNDARAFSNWAGKRLPTEVEWEFAARGGLQQKRFPWGDKLQPEGKDVCNIWQGKFPTENTMEDGFVGTAPALSFPPNGYGFYNMAGNVWEWCANDFFETPAAAIASKAMRGGSYLCHDSYCNRYRVAARTSNTVDSAAGNIGFRCVTDVHLSQKEEDINS